MKRSAPSSGETFTAADVAASIARIDRMSSRCVALLPRNEKQISKPRKIRLDVSPRQPRSSLTVSLEPDTRSDTSLEKSSSSSSSIDTQRQPSFNPQERFDRLRREWRADTTKAHDYPHICGGGGFGDDVDKAFEECSNAPY